MSDLAPFVAATIRDKVVQDLHDEIQDLRDENRRLQSDGGFWTVQITGPRGSPVYSTGQISQREVLQQISVGDIENRHKLLVWPSVAMHEGGEGVACRLDSFLECQLILTTSLGQKIVENVEAPYADIGNGVRAHDGRFEIGWHFYLHDGDGGDGKVFSGMYLDMPIPPGRLNTLDPELVTELESGMNASREEALPLAEDIVNSNAPIRFREVVLNTHMLIGTLS